jgi:hypothetical protein
MTEEHDIYGYPVEQSEHMQQVMLSLFDIMDEAELAKFPIELIRELNVVRLKFMDEFEAQFPGYGKGRAVWR